MTRGEADRTIAQCCRSYPHLAAIINHECERDGRRRRLSKSLECQLPETVYGELLRAVRIYRRDRRAAK